MKHTLQEKRPEAQTKYEDLLHQGPVREGLLWFKILKSFVHRYYCLLKNCYRYEIRFFVIGDVELNWRCGTELVMWNWNWWCGTEIGDVELKSTEGSTHGEPMQWHYISYYWHLPRSSRRAILLKYLFFFSRSNFFKEISRTHQIFQEKEIP